MSIEHKDEVWVGWATGSLTANSWASEYVLLLRVPPWFTTRRVNARWFRSYTAVALN
jgi:hypothetical protein